LLVCRRKSGPENEKSSLPAPASFGGPCFKVIKLVADGNKCTHLFILVWRNYFINGAIGAIILLLAQLAHSAVTGSKIWPIVMK
jgi:hypothetical protein